MPVFDFNQDDILDSIAQAMEEAGADTSTEQFQKIAEQIDASFPGIIDVLTVGMAEHWRQEARNIGGWGSKYAQAITYKDGEIYLDDKKMDRGSGKPYIMFAKMVEEGVKSWSIKNALLKSDKVRIGKDGVKYIIIPFPVATPRKEGQGKMSAQFGGREMSQEIHKIVKSGGKIRPGTTLSSGQDISGLTRYNTRQLHSGYGIFRVVSEKSKGWQYPKVPPEPVFASVLKEVDRRINEVIKEFIKGIVKEYTT